MTEQPKVPVRVVVCAANQYTLPDEFYETPLIVCGPRHMDSTMQRVLESVDEFTRTLLSKPVQGFVDQWGVFMTREEALIVATAAGQINVRRPKTFPENKLFSEDLY